MELQSDIKEASKDIRKPFKSFCRWLVCALLIGGNGLARADDVSTRVDAYLSHAEASAGKTLSPDRRAAILKAVNKYSDAKTGGQINELSIERALARSMFSVKLPRDEVKRQMTKYAEDLALHQSKEAVLGIGVVLLPYLEETGPVLVTSSRRAGRNALFNLLPTELKSWGNSKILRQVRW